MSLSVLPRRGERHHQVFGLCSFISSSTLANSSSNAIQSGHSPTQARKGRAASGRRSQFLSMAIPKSRIMDRDHQHGASSRHAKPRHSREHAPAIHVIITRLVIYITPYSGWLSHSPTVACVHSLTWLSPLARDTRSTGRNTAIQKSRIGPYSRCPALRYIATPLHSSKRLKKMATQKHALPTAMPFATGCTDSDCPLICSVSTENR